ncbi:hypothetical protein SAMN05216223_13250 [Actinacidiphila yanglinensis]|uniref:DUF4232 domain-containing protein n=1 Tax=Actinacidiphila yanglinensis TaxID=310779 RepID=A0A1H6ED29_9ACTN|nr:hypothetical protein [Actinacidiphila yanglinensis]SEG95183.1 hypothetical protein SAMN05216223_13250 [Actinacidiphila yanglinensis]
MTAPHSPDGPNGTHGPEAPDDAPGMDEQTPNDAQHDEAPAPESAPAPDEATPPRETAPRETAPHEAAPSSEAATPAPAASDDDSTDDVTPGGLGTAALGDLTADEASLRALMHDAVNGLHASPDALERLRRGVPLRRQRRRQAMLGAAAAVLLVGLAVPAVVRAAGSADHTTAAPVGSGSSYTVTSDPGAHRTDGAANPSGAATSAPDSSSKHSSDAPVGPPSSPSDSGAPAPDCSSAQLGKGASQAGSPDTGGRVYGWFRVSNVSDAPCTVPSGGIVQAVAHGSAEQSAIQVVGHTQGDPASDLPTDVSDGPIVLLPGQDYEVAFAWVPAAAGTDGCAATTPPPASSSPTPTATDTSGTDTGAEADGSGGEAQPPAGDPPSAPPPTVTLDHTPAAGAPVVAGPVLQDACAGTVYTTPAMADAKDAPAP